MKTSAKISIFLGILVIDLVFFTLVRQLLPESYEWTIVATSNATQIPLEVARSLFVIGGFIIALICTPIILYLAYCTIKQTGRREP